MTDPTPAARPRVLVTGSTGLVGRHIVEALSARGLEVHGTARTAMRVPGITHHSADLTNTATRCALLDTVRPDIIVHAAWVTEHGAYWRSPLNLAWTAATASLAAEAHARGVKRLVGLGTCAEYEWGTDAPLSENASPLIPATLYGACKDATRRVLEAFGRDTGLSVAWARLGMLYGPGEHKDRFVASLATAFASGKPARMSSGRVIRDYMHARDVGAAVAALALAPVDGAVNIGAGAPMTLADLGRLMAQLAGRPDLLQVGALPDRPGEPARIILDLARLNGEVGFRPAISLEQGFREMLAACAPAQASA